MLIQFEQQFRKKFYKLSDKIFDSNVWSEGNNIKNFETKFSQITNLHSIAVSNCGTGLLSIFEYLNVKNFEVIVPANTFYATILAIKKAGGIPVYVDCNKDDLCISLEELRKKISVRTKAVTVVHIGGHIAFQINEIVKFCKENNLYLVEDCAHAHGALYNGKSAGSFGFAGAYSFYSTKTLPLGEGGMVVSKNKNFINWLKCYRNYGKKTLKNGYKYSLLNGFNYRISEFTAALGIIQLERINSILNYKRNLAKIYDKIFDRRIKFPEGMISGYYKYIVFDYKLKQSSGKVYSLKDLPLKIENKELKNFPNTLWISKHHKCVPIFYGFKPDF